MKDFVRNSSGDLDIQDGDLVVDSSILFHQEDIIIAGKGWNHFMPMLGVGIQRYLNDTDNLPALKGSIRVELEKDGQVVERVAFNGTNIEVKAIYG